MFWGLVMEPNKRYNQVVEKAFYISHAALDTSTGDTEPCQVMMVDDRKNFLLCTLQKNKDIQMPLHLLFKQGDSISLLTNGKSNIHLTGYHAPEHEDESPGDEEEEDDAEEEEDDAEEEEDDDEEEDPPELVNAAKRKLENAKNNANAKKLKVDWLNMQEKKAKKPVAQDSDDSDSEDDGNLLRAPLNCDPDTDENTSTEGESDEESVEEGNEEEAEAEEDDVGAEADSSEADTTMDTSTEMDVLMSKLSETQMKLLKKLAQQDRQPQVDGVKKAKKPVFPKKTVSGGVVIEDLKVGDGAVAKFGKVVQVYYEARLKANNKIFDKCLKGPGFKFRLGCKEVISGLEVGVAYMRVGGKRRIVCPPAMAYGAKGAPPAIPPNSKVVVEVKLKNVK